MWTDPVTGEVRGGVQKTNYSHEAMADLILSNPAIDQNDIAAHFGYTPGWVSQVISSDAFQAFIADRRAEIIDPVLRGAAEEAFKGLVMQSLAVLRRKLDVNPSDQFALEVFKNSTRALGYGARPQASLSIHNNFSLMGVLAGLPSHREKIVESIPPAPA